MSSDRGAINLGLRLTAAWAVTGLIARFLSPRARDAAGERQSVDQVSHPFWHHLPALRWEACSPGVWLL